jgi:hypothetical protein
VPDVLLHLLSRSRIVWRGEAADLEISYTQSAFIEPIARPAMGFLLLPL